MLTLFTLNYYAARNVVLKQPQRVTVPYSPFFLHQVAAGHVGARNQPGDDDGQRYRRNQAHD